ncbi:hypothetical protein KKI90_21530 [Xenorhabdus bovienii]|uniref:hypothetical protein n=1 Tax=Xenorhabdus bovienii TaxID=40576 RepID=UPI00237CC24D|nr:hypothetical protein [Xenorhabdus bovienii]MDE1488588.1 hypothetical protein [Xenorhabdus bovienii]MDE9443787.1 hypothetical protein [Xenorhabdus bovienii]MDE9479603.1 hypothetical protein [Xenorhabdus bovienii]MDE9495676.1 hypothetical protein [Xenorhabdus bovienii]MDE9504084.1 hypothetical protein [Xenorhabdus bovienii]
MALLTEFNLVDLMRTHRAADKVIFSMKKSIGIYWKGRHHPIARSRIKSAVNIIRRLREGGVLK